jgi:Ala-tRNA(Pro) deacylase
MVNLYRFLADHDIAYERLDHPPVYTVADVERLVPPLPGAKTKNLFLRDKKGDRHFLVVVPAPKRVDIKALPQAVGSDRLSFGSPDRLKKYLGIEPGAVTLLAIVNDPGQAVEVFIDKALWEADAFHFHPLVNTSTLIISRSNLERFIAASGHAIQIIDVPEQKRSDE